MEEKDVMITIHPAMVKAGMWNSDCCAQFAVAMDAENGDIVWYRSADWRAYGMHNGHTRVARIAPKMLCDKVNHNN